MYTQQLPISSLQLILIFIFFSLPASYTSYNITDQFSECSQLYNCGQIITGVGYPFWGDQRPQSCGLQGFELKCNESYAIISMGTQSFRLLSINESNHQMNISSIYAYNIGDSLCVEGLLNKMETNLNAALFTYSRDVEFVNVYYYCPSDIDTTYSSYAERGNCSVKGATSNYVLSLDPLPETEKCGVNITIPVLTSAIQEMKDNNSMEFRNLRDRSSNSVNIMGMKDVINKGFSVDYKIDEEYCSTCKRSGGLCWSAPNATQKTCLCKDTDDAPVCPTQNIGSSPSGNSGGTTPGGTAVGGSSSNSGMKIGIGIGVAVSVCAVIFFIVAFRNRRRKGDIRFEKCIMELGNSIPQRYRYSDVKKMTNSFKYELGEGAFGKVYRGTLPDRRVVAVKVLHSSKGSGDDFINEVKSIGTTSHVNVVTLLGFCYERQNRALIYEFMPNGSLDKFIFQENEQTQPKLGWQDLFDITLGIARGLEYLHHRRNTRVLHLDIKPNNILLDENFCPKIADFGLAKVYSGKGSIVSMKGGRGTLGYVAPEVGNTNFGGVSHKSDVYSFGVVVLEMVGGRKNLDLKMFEDKPSEVYFPYWIYKRVELNEDLSMLGDIVMTQEENEIAKKMIIVALWCIRHNPSERPSIVHAIEMLEGSLEDLKLPPKP